MSDQIDLLNTLLQAYQGQADTAGPYYNLYSIFGPAYGQVALDAQQQQMFGYNVGPNGGIGSSATPPSGCVGDPYYGVSPRLPPSSGGAPATGGTPTAGSASIYSPPEGTRIGLGHEFMDPYAGQLGPSATPGYHPGVLGLNTTALNAYGPAVTGGLFASDPYLQNAIDFQTLALLDSSNPLQNSPLLNALNQSASSQLAANGQLTPEQERSASQAALSALAGAGSSTIGSQAVAAQLLNRDALVNARQQQAQAFANAVQGLNFTQQGQELQRQGLAGNLATQAAGSATSGITNPILQILGLGSLNATSNPSSAIANQSQLTNPFLNIGADIAGANFNAQVAQDIANQNQNAATTGGLISAGGSILGGLLASSDKRIKKDVKKVGESESGIPEYEWTYKFDPYERRYHGTTAQALEKVKPEAVVTDPYSGLKAVRYDLTDVSFREVDPYERKAA